LSIQAPVGRGRREPTPHRQGTRITIPPGGAHITFFLKGAGTPDAGSGNPQDIGILEMKPLSEISDFCTGAGCNDKGNLLLMIVPVINANGK